MKIKIAFLLLILSGNIATLVAQNQTSVRREFEQALSQKGGEINTISCHFTQTRALAILAKESVKKGHFSYQRPDNILLKFEDGDYIKMTSTQFQMRNAGTVNSMKINSNPMLKELKRILAACMSGDVAQMAAGFKVDLTQTDGAYQMTLAAARNRGGSKISRITLAFDKRDMSLQMLKMEEPSGDFTRYDFSDKLFNKPIGEKIFD